MKKNLDKLFKQFIDKNLKGYKYVYLTSDLRGFLVRYKINDANELCKTFINILLKKKITILVPSYSYTSKNKFYVEKTNSNLSYLTKWCLKQKNSFRTHHPIFSFCILGKNKNFFSNIGKSAYGKNSVWEKLLKEKTSLLHIGRPFSWGNTVIHFVEFKENAEYRYNKVFKTKVYKDNKYLGTNFSAFVQKKRYKSKKIYTNTKKIAKLVEKQKFYCQIGNNKSLTNFTHLDFKSTFIYMSQKFKQNNKIFINTR